MPNGKPNILVLWGDDIGTWNLSCNNRGMMGYQTPNIDRLAHEGVGVHRLLRPAELHRRPGRLHHRPEPAAHRPHQGRAARHRLRHPARGPDDRRTAQAARVRDGPVRQEPPRRPRRAPAHQSRLRRVLRQPLPPQRRGGAGARGLPQGPRLQEAVRAAWRDPQLGDARRHTEDRGHRPAHAQAHGDHRRRDHRADPRVSRRGHRRRQAVLPLVERDAHALAHPRQGRELAASAARASTTTAWSSTTATSA